MSVPKFKDLKAKYDLKNGQYDWIAGKGFICEYLQVDDKVYRDVYMPSEDTFTLIDAIHCDLSQDKEALKRLISEGSETKKIIEVG